MGDSWGWDGTTFWPSIMSAWSKVFLGWVTPTVITSEGEYTIARSIDNEAVYKITEGFPSSSQYLLIENRQAVEDESSNPGSGLLIWMIDERADQNNTGYPGQTDNGIDWPANGNHYMISLLQADGAFGLEKRDGNGGDSGNGGNYYESSVTGVGPSVTYTSGPFPNTDAMQLQGSGGDPTRTDVSIYDISASGDEMTFKVSFKLAGTTFSPTPAPTVFSADGVVVCDFYETVNTDAATKNTVDCPFVACVGAVLQIRDAR
jgi:hypothetical protein